MIDAALFDLDGTLLDLPVDIEPVRREVEALFSAAGFRGPASPLLDAIDLAAASLPGEPGVELRRRARAVVDRAELVAAAGAVARPGACALVERLAGRRVPLAIVTNQGRACVAAALAAAGLDRAGWRLFTRDDVARPKPAPDAVVAAARALCPAGGELLFAGDSPGDLRAGRAAAAELGPTYSLHLVLCTAGLDPVAALL
jgi:phosphoglycolate phosphatase-like HAD superfamily hydrolase